MRARLAAVLTAAAVTAALAAAPAHAWRSYAPIDAAASWLAMRDVSVRCLTPEETANDPLIVFYGAVAYVDGWVELDGRWHPGDNAVFKHGICETLLALLAWDARPYTVSDLAWALLVLAHESGHLRGHEWSGSEALTECWAIRHVGYVAAWFGVSDPAARRLIVALAVAHHRSLPIEYQLDSCKLPDP